MVRKILLACGALSSLLYVAMNIVVPMQWDGYSSVSQTVSELSAIGAPTRGLWVQLAIAYGALFTAFSWGVLQSARRGGPLRIVGGLMLAGGLLGFAWPPMHLREVLAAGQGTLTDTMHIAFTMVWGLLVLLAMGFGAAAFGKQFRLYSIATMVIVLVFGTLTGMAGPRISANLPTPWVGVWERINIGAFMLWVAALSIGLLRAQTTRASKQLGKSLIAQGAVP
jgi:hypothetical protein